MIKVSKKLIVIWAIVGGLYHLLGKIEGFKDQEWFGMLEKGVIISGIIYTCMDLFPVTKSLKELITRILAYYLPKEVKNETPTDYPMPTDEDLIRSDKNALVSKVRATVEAAIDRSLKIKEDGLGPESLIPTKFKPYKGLTFFMDKEEDKDPKEMDFTVRDDTFQYIILGKAGSGKSFSLLATAKSMLPPGKIEKPNYKVPVYIDLSTWTSSGLNLTNWIDAYIRKVYKEDDKYSWLVFNRQIIPFLDGFDEVAPEDRRACFDSIMEFADKNSFVLSCRKKEFIILLNEVLEFKALENKHTTVYEVMPLVDGIIEDTINNLAQENKAGILELIRKTPIYDKENPLLSNGLRTPLILNLFISSFDKLSEEEKTQLENTKSEAFRNLLWKKYDQIVFDKKCETNPKCRWIRTRIVWLSKLMKGVSFSIEQVQPDWFTKIPEFHKPMGKLSYYLLSRIVSGIILSIGVGSIIATPFEFFGNAVASGVFVVVLTLIFNKYAHETRLLAILTPLIFAASLAAFSGIFQGFSAPRMSEIGGFSPSEAIPGVIFGLFYGCVFGLRKNEQSDAKDILPIQKYYFLEKKKRVSALKNGLKGGFIMGICAGAIGVLIKEYNFAPSFYEFWLKKFTSTHQVFNQEITIFLLAFLIGFFLVFMVIILSQSLDREKIRDENSNSNNFKFGLNYGIKSTVIKAFTLSLIPFLAVSVLFVTILYLYYKGDPESIFRGLSIGSGVGLISYLLLGGLEVINHWSLRILLYFYGILPLNYTKWLTDGKDLNLIYKTGGSLRFLHPTLIGYYCTVETKNNPQVPDLRKPKLLIVVAAVLSLVFLGLVAEPFYTRFVANKYWKDASYSALSITSPNKEDRIAIPKPGEVYIGKSGFMRVEVKGRVKLGTFTGRMAPYGTEMGIFGIPIGDDYDRYSIHRHGQLLYQRTDAAGTQWAHCPVINKYCHRFSTKCDTIAVVKGDRISFSINDKEYQNNLGKFKIIVRIVPKEEKEKK